MDGNIADTASAGSEVPTRFRYRLIPVTLISMFTAFELIVFLIIQYAIVQSLLHRHFGLFRSGSISDVYLPRVMFMQSLLFLHLVVGTAAVAAWKYGRGRMAWLVTVIWIGIAKGMSTVGNWTSPS
jgi:hypothetical protein